jgi:hypothetical protein
MVGNRTESGNMWAVGGLQTHCLDASANTEMAEARPHFFIIPTNLAITIPFACGRFRSVFLVRQGS